MISFFCGAATDPRLTHLVESQNSGKTKNSKNCRQRKLFSLQQDTTEPIFQIKAVFEN